MDVATLQAATVQAKRRGLGAQTMVVLGDSLTEQGGMIPAAVNIKGSSPWTWGNALLGQRFKIITNAGVGGETTTQIRARFNSAVLANSPGWIHLLAGTNNMGVVGGLAQAKVDIAWMLTAAWNAGIRVALGTLPPRISANYTGTIKSDTFLLNAWIADQARTRPNVVLADYFTALADGTVGNYRSTVAGWNPTTDGTHLSNAGGFVCGRVFADALASVTRPAVFYSNPAPGANLLGDPRFSSGGSGSAPTSYIISGNASGSVTWSKTTRTDLPGSWQTVVVPTGSTGLTIQGNATSAWSVGDQLVGAAEFNLSALDQAATSGFQGFMLHLKAYNGSIFTDTLSAFFDYAGPNWTRAGVLRTPILTIPSGTTTVALFVEIAGGGTYSLDRLGVYNATTYASL